MNTRFVATCQLIKSLLVYYIHYGTVLLFEELKYAVIGGQVYRQYNEIGEFGGIT